MIDRIFFAVLLPLPIIVAVAMLLYFARAWRSATPRLRRSHVLAGLWLGACAGILIYCRERIRGWTGVDFGTITVFMLGSAGSLVLFGIGIGLIGVIGRSTRGSPLCPRCWYNMDGVDPQADGRTVCPECGSEVRSISDLMQRKRWPLLIAIAVTLQLAGQFSYQLIRADHGGAQNFVPTTVLIAGMFSLPADAIIGAPTPFDSATLSGRLANGRVAEWQKTWAIGKAIDAIARAEHPDAVSRASTILNRSRFEGEIPFEAWKSSVRLLCVSHSPGAGEAMAYLAECYVRARSTVDSSGRLSIASDPQRCAAELRELVPLLLERVSAATVRTPEWWGLLRLVALAGEHATPIVPMLEARVLVEDSEMGRANTAAVLAMLSVLIPDASEASLRAFGDLPGPEQPRVLNAISRFIRPSPDLLPSFRALAVCGEPVLEIAGATGLLGAKAERCEGATLLLLSLSRQIQVGQADLGVIYWQVARDPGDGASTMLIVYLKDLALNSTPMFRIEAMAHLSNIGRDFEQRSTEVLAFLDYVGSERNPEIAERARAMAVDVRTARSAPIPLRKVAIIR